MASKEDQNSGGSCEVVDDLIDFSSHSPPQVNLMSGVNSSNLDLMINADLSDGDFQQDPTETNLVDDELRFHQLNEDLGRALPCKTSVPGGRNAIETLDDIAQPGLDVQVGLKSRNETEDGKPTFGNAGVSYESESEEETYNFQNKAKYPEKRSHRHSGDAQNFKSSSSYGSKGATHSSQRQRERPGFDIKSDTASGHPKSQYFGGATVPPSRTKSQQSRPVTISPSIGMNHLSGFGAWEEVNESDQDYNVISTYTKNSSDVDTSLVRIHQIYQLHPSEPEALPPSSKQLKMLLWFKTTNQSVTHLSKQSRGIVAFYDRLARALLVNPRNLTEPSKQVVLLCAINLGKIHKSDEGYRHWSKHPSLDGHDSVKGQGRIFADEEENLHGNIVVPWGKSKEDIGQDLSLEYSEYMVCDAARISIRYAVQIEVFPGTSHR